MSTSKSSKNFQPGRPSRFRVSPFDLTQFIFLKLLSLFSLFLVVSTPFVYAGPQGEDVKHGDVQVERPDENLTEIDQDTQEAIVEFSSFDVGELETVRFDQPGADARILNRVLSDNPSEIRGNLTADGEVYLTNPAGILFGPNSTVNVGKLYAAAGHLSNDNFLDGKDLFTDLSGTVENAGSLEGTGIHLLGKRVANFGKINATDGVITMSSGDDVLLGTRTGHVFAKVKDAGERSGNEQAGIKNDGMVNAGQDGTVKMSAGDMFATSIFHDGGTVKGGEIDLDGGSGVTVSGRLDASGDHSGDAGGEVTVLGEELELTEASVDVSGSDGGTVELVGSEVEIRDETNIDATAEHEGGSVTLDAENRLTLGYGTSVDVSGETGGQISVRAEQSYHENTLRAAGTGGGGGTITLDMGTSYTANSSAKVDVSGETGGSIELTTTGKMVSSGTYLATGSSGEGGTIEVGGPGGIGLLSAELNASGTAGGGTIRLGGSKEGGTDDENDLTPAHGTVISQGSSLIADATGSGGDGGEIILFGESKAEFYGEASARPGTASGAGGFIELSTDGTLDFTGEDTLKTGRGERTGEVLIDPKNISIVSSAPGGTSLAKSLVSGSEIRNPGESLISDGDFFGNALDINEVGDIFVVGADGDDTGGGSDSNRGAAYVFSLDTSNLSGTPKLEKKIANGTGGLSLTDSDKFGRAVSLNGSGNILSIGAIRYNTDGNAKGAAYVFSLDTGNLSGTPTLEKKIADGTGSLTLSDQDFFGNSLTLNGTGDILAVGASGDDTGGQNRGASYIFSLDPANLSGTPTLEKKIADGTGSLTLNSGDYFGGSIALNGAGDILVVGAGRDDTGGSGTFADRGAVYAFSLNTNSDPWSVTKQKKIADGTGSLSLRDGDNFGSSAALNGSGDILAVGADGDPADELRGAAYLFSLNPENLSETPKVKKKLADGTGGLSLNRSDFFGRATALNEAGDIFAVGSPGDDTGNGGGAAHLFSLDTSTQAWSLTEETKMTTVEGEGSLTSLSLSDYDKFGRSAALNGTGDILTVGASGDNTGGVNSGAAYVFGLDPETPSRAPVLEKKIADGTGSLSLNIDVRFGKSVALNATGDILTVGASRDNTGGRSRGAAYVFRLDPGDLSGTPTLKKKIADGTGSLSLTKYDWFGRSAALNESGDILTVGAPGDDTGGNDRGAAYLFRLDPGDLSGTPTLEKKIVGGTGSLSLSKDDRFGRSVSLNGIGDILSVGAPGDDTGGVNRGAVYLFNLDQGNLSDTPQLVNKIADGTGSLSLNDNVRFGTSTDLNGLNGTGNILAAGAPFDNTGGSNRGAAYVFSLNTDDLSGTPTLEEKIADGTGSLSLSDGDRFGRSLALNGPGNILAIGAPFDDAGGFRIGALYIFNRNSSVSDDPNDADFPTSPSSNFTLLPSDIVSLLDGSDLTLQANNDIDVDAQIDASGNDDPGNLTLEAGRDININENILLQGAFTGIANSSNALADHRDSGEADITMASGTTIQTSHLGGPISLLLGTGPGGGKPTGSITVSNLLSQEGTITVDGPGNIQVMGDLDANGPTGGVNLHSRVNGGGILIASGANVSAEEDSALIADSLVLNGSVDVENNRLTIKPESEGDENDRVRVVSEADAPESLSISEDWLDTGWPNRLKVTIDGTQVEGDLNEFPVYVDLSDLSNSNFFSEVSAGGDEIRVTKEDGTTLVPREVTQLDRANETGELHFRADQLSAANDHVFYIYYGNENAGVPDPAYQGENVWANSFAMTQHLEETGGGTAFDSTANEIDASIEGGIHLRGVPGKLGGAFEFDGDEDVLLQNQFTGDERPVTISMWYNYEGSGNLDTFVGAANGEGATIGGIEDNGSYRWATAGGGLFRDGNVEHGPWNHVALTVEKLGSGSRYVLYENGEIIADRTDQWNPATNPLGIAALNREGGESVAHFEGWLDEVRFARSARSKDWVATEFNNQNEPSLFHSSIKDETVDPNTKQDVLQLSAEAVNKRIDAETLQIGGDRSGDITFDESLKPEHHFQEVRFSTGGSITHSAGELEFEGRARLDAAENIVLGDGATKSVEFRELTFNSGGRVDITEDTPIELVNENTADVLALTSRNGHITDRRSARLRVTNNARFDTRDSGGDIELGDTASNLVDLGTLTFKAGHTVDITEESGTVLTGTSTAEELNLTSLHGSISDAPGASLYVNNAPGTGNASFETRTAGSDIVLGDTPFDTLELGTLTFNSGGTVRINEDSETILEGVSTAHLLQLTSHSGDITDRSDAILEVTGNATFNNIGAGSNITLGDSAYDTVNVGTLRFNSDGNVTIRENSGTNFSGTSTANSLDLEAEGAIRDDGSAALSVAGNAEFSDSSGAGIRLDDAYSFGSVTFNSVGDVVIDENDATTLSGDSTANALTLMSDGVIRDVPSASLNVDRNATFDNSGAGSNITLGDTTSDLMTFGTLTVRSNGAATVTEDDATELAGTSHTGGLDLTSRGSITDSGQLTVDGDTSLNAENASGGNYYDIELGDTSSTSFNGSLAIISAEDVVISDDTGTVLDDVTTNAADGITDGTVSGDAGVFDLASGGSVRDTSTASISVAANAMIQNTGTGAGIKLGDTGSDTLNVGTLTFNSDGDVAITENSDMDIVGGPNTGMDVRLKATPGITVGSAGIEAGGDIIATASEDVVAGADLSADRDIIVRADNNSSGTGDFRHVDGSMHADSDGDDSGGILVAAHNIILDEIGDATEADGLLADGTVANADVPPRGEGDDPTAIGLLAANHLQVNEDVQPAGSDGDEHVVMNADADLSLVDDTWPTPIAGTTEGPAPDGTGDVNVQSGEDGTSGANGLAIQSGGATEIAGINVNLSSAGNSSITITPEGSVNRNDDGDNYHGSFSLTLLSADDLTVDRDTTINAGMFDVRAEADFDFSSVNSQAKLGITDTASDGQGRINAKGPINRLLRTMGGSMMRGPTSPQAGQTGSSGSDDDKSSGR